MVAMHWTLVCSRFGDSVSRLLHSQCGVSMLYDRAAFAMIYWVVTWAVKFRGIVIGVAAGFLLFGLFQLDSVKRDLLPEFSPTTVEVQTEALGLSAAEVEQLITVPLEQDLLNGVAFLAKIESASLPGLSSVVMTFEPGTDLLDARQVVAERLTQAAAVATQQLQRQPVKCQHDGDGGRIGHGRKVFGFRWGRRV